MRVYHVVLAFLLVLAAVQLPSLATAASPCNVNTCTTRIARVVSTNDWGTTFVNDTVRLNALGAVSSVTLGFPSSISSNIHLISAKDLAGKSIQVNPMPTNQTGKYQPYEFAFPSPVTGNYNFTVNSVFSDLISYHRIPGRYTFY